MAISKVKVDWNPGPVTEEIKQAMNEIAKDGASYIREAAARNLERSAPDSTGKLASEIDFKVSQFKDGGYIVEAQGPGNYTKFYASFVELGTRFMPGKHYMKKAAKRGKYYIRAKLKQYFNRVE